MPVRSSSSPAERPLVVHLLTPDGEGDLGVTLRVIAPGRVGRLAAGGSRALAGVAIAVKARAESLGEHLSYLVVGAKFATDQAAIAAARKRLQELQAKFTAAGPAGCLDVLSAFMHRKARTDVDRSNATLMLYQWVRDYTPPYYLAAEDMLHQAFVAHLHCVATGQAPLPFSMVAKLIAEAHAPTSPFASADNVRIHVQAVFSTAYPDTMNRVADAELDSANLPGMRSGQDLGLAWFFIVAGLLSGATEIAAVALLIDVAVNYLQFLHDMDMAERDDEISEEEVSSVGWSLVFVGVPVLPFSLERLPKSRLAQFLQGGFSAFQLASLLALFAMFVRGAIGQLQEALAFHERLQLARKAGFGDYVEVDMNTSIVIPRSAMRPLAP